jgi:hypothetical protein
MDDLIKIVECPRLGNGHLMMIVKRECTRNEVMKKVFGVLGHFERWDFNVLLANGATSLFQTRTDEMYGEGSMLLHLASFMNTGPEAPFIFTDQKKVPATRSHVGRTSKVKIGLPILCEDRLEYLKVGPPLSKPYDEWAFHAHETFDGTILKCKGDPKVKMQPLEEVLVDYNYGKNRDADQIDRYNGYVPSEALKMVAEKKKMNRRVGRADKMVGLSKRELKKAKKEQEEAEAADREKRVKDRFDKYQSVMSKYIEKSDSVASSDFFDDVSVASDSTNTFGMDYERSSEVQLSREEHDTWNTYEEYLQDNNTENNEVAFNSTQFYNEADAILKKVMEKEKKKSPKKKYGSSTDKCHYGENDNTSTEHTTIEDKKSSQLIIDLTDSPDDAEKIRSKRESFFDKLQKKKKQEKLMVEREHAKIRHDSHQDFLYSDDPPYYPSEETINNDEFQDEEVPVEEEELLLVNDEESRVSSITGKEELLMNESSVEEQEELVKQKEGVLTQLRERKSPSKKRKSITQLRIEGRMNNKKKKNN